MTECIVKNRKKSFFESVPFLISSIFSGCKAALSYASSDRIIYYNTKACDLRFNPSVHRAKSDRLVSARMLHVCDNYCRMKTKFISTHIDFHIDLIISQEILFVLIDLYNRKKSNELCLKLLAC